MRGQDWREVPVPPRLARRPVDARGFPITFVTHIDPETGQPDFTVINGDQVSLCCRYNLCGLCGEQFEKPPVVFIGGPKSIENRAFLDPPMHPECAEYAAKVCPHLAISTSRYSKVEEGQYRHPLLSTERAEKFGLYYTLGTTADMYGDSIIFFPRDPQKIVWLQEDQ